MPNQTGPTEAPAAIPKELSTGKRVMAIVLAFSVIAFTLLGMIQLQGRILDGVRAYVRGEGLWAKAQKDCVLHLERYVESRAEADYQAFDAAVAVVLGDREARRALSRVPPDRQAAKAGFLRGGNHPDDVDSLISFYRYFGFISYVREALDIWTAGDEKIDELIRVAETIRATPRGSAGIGVLRQRLQQLNRELTDLEDRFSGVLGDGARWVRQTLWLTSLTLLLALLGFGAVVSRQVLRGIARSEQQLQLAATVFTASKDGILVTDPALTIVAANAALCEMMGWSADELKGKTPRLLRSGHTSDERYREMWLALNQQGSWQGELVDRTRHGALLPIRSSISAVKDSRGAVKNYVAIITDISERKAQEERLRYLAHHDALTGLPNRALLDDRIEQAAKKTLRNGGRFAVLFLDLDRFKAVNDRHGHEVGDQLLQLVAGRLVASLRDTDTVTRMGGDEFAILLTDVDVRSSVEELAGTIAAAVREPYRIAGETIEIGVSIGIGLFPDDAADPAALLRHADAAMYRMKNERRTANGAGSPSTEDPGAVPADHLT